MTSATGKSKRTSRSLQGFTLIEIVAVIFIIMLISGIAVGIIFAAGNYRLESAENELIALARRASRTATTEGVAHTIQVTPSLCQMLDAGGEPLGNPIPAPSDTRFTIRPLGESKWLTPPREGHAWRFEPSGLSIPISIRLADTKGEFWEIDFGALAGTPIDQRSVSYAK